MAAKILGNAPDNDILRSVLEGLNLGLDGNHLISVQGGSNSIHAANGDDVVDADPGSDSTNGNVGGSGNDSIVGGTGHGVIKAGAGHDTVSCGNGRDYIARGDGRDRIMDVQDMLCLSSASMGGLTLVQDDNRALVPYGFTGGGASLTENIQLSISPNRFGVANLTADDLAC